MSVKLLQASAVDLLPSNRLREGHGELVSHGDVFSNVLRQSPSNL